MLRIALSPLRRVPRTRRRLACYDSTQADPFITVAKGITVAVGVRAGTHDLVAGGARDFRSAKWVADVVRLLVGLD